VELPGRSGDRDHFPTYGYPVVSLPVSGPRRGDCARAATAPPPLPARAVSASAFRLSSTILEAEDAMKLATSSGRVTSKPPQMQSTSWCTRCFIKYSVWWPGFAAGIGTCKVGM